MQGDRSRGLDSAALEEIFHRAPFGVVSSDDTVRYICVDKDFAGLPVDAV
jgi:hypothetical protein